MGGNQDPMFKRILSKIQRVARKYGYKLSEVWKIKLHDQSKSFDKEKQYYPKR